MNTENYKKAANSQKLSAEINDGSKDREKKSPLIEEFATSKPELICELYNRLNDKKRVAEIINIVDNIDSEKNVKHLLQVIDRKNKYVKIFNVLKVASSIAAIAVISLLIWKTSYEGSSINKQVIGERECGTLLNPMLRLSSGKVYELVADADRATRDDYIIEQNSKLNFRDLQKYIGGDSTKKREDVLYFELSVPKKSSYTVVLPDSSEVILNANSSISYPEKFAANKREVIIKGEAFFNVKKSTIPFVVNAENSYIKVYGTSFNINARDKDKVKTILVTGIVGVGAAGIKEQILKPNQMAIVNVDCGVCVIKDVNANNNIGWVTGSIICLNNDLEDLINDIESWYGVDIRYDKHKEEIKNIKMNILIKHTMDIDAVLKLIEKVVDIKFIDEGGYYGIELVK